MAPPKCIMHDSACVADEMTDVSTPVVKDAWRHFGLWVPPIYHYALHDANAITDRLEYFHRPDFVDLAGTIANLNRLKTEFGFNAISIGVDDFIDVYTWTPFLLFDAFMHQDCVWRLDELLLGLGNGCHVWGLRALRMFRQLTGNAKVLAVGIDEPMLHSKSFEEDGRKQSNYVWCKLETFGSNRTGPIRIQSLYDEVHANGDRLIIGESPRVVDSGVFGLLGSWSGLRRSLPWADGFLYNGYSIGCAAGSPQCTLPIKAWYVLRDEFGSSKRSIGVWIANSCHEYFYNPSIWGVRPVCQKDYFNTLLGAARAPGIQDIFLYGGDLALEILKKCFFFRPPDNPFQLEPELTKDVIWEIHSCGISPDKPDEYLSRCPVFRKAVLKIFWRRLLQYRQAALEENILYWHRTRVPTGRKLYCTEGPSRTYRGYSIIYCANCTKWEYSPRGVQFCPPEFWRASMAPSPQKGLSGTSGVSTLGTPVYQYLSPSPPVSHGAFVTIPGLTDLEQGTTGESGSKYGDEPVPPSQRRYTVRYFIR